MKIDKQIKEAEKNMHEAWEIYQEAWFDLIRLCVKNTLEKHEKSPVRSVS